MNPTSENSPASNHSGSTDLKKNRREKVSQTYWAQEQELDAIESSIPLSVRMNLLADHGDFSLAYSTAVQPRLEYFGDENGFISFRRRYRHIFALGDPMCASSQLEKLLDSFLASNRRPIFCQVGKRTADQLANRGYLINEMGVDTTLDLADYNFAGKQKEWLRYAANWSKRRDFKIVEASFDTITPSTVEDISEAWRKTRTVKHKEVRFLNRPIVLREESDVRKFFYVSPEGKVLAFVFLDPLYRCGEVMGYVTSIKRRHPDAPIYAEQAIMKFAIETLKAEGHAELKLGLSPLAFIDDDEFKNSKLTTRLFRHAFTAKWVNKHFYHLTGHADYKRRFRGREEKVFLATPSRFNPIRFLALVGLCGVA